MNTNKLLIAIAISGFGLIHQAKAQENDTKKVFTLQEVLTLANENNSEILKSVADVNSAKADNQQANASFLPSVELSSTYSATTDPLYVFGSKLQQGIVENADFDPNSLNDPDTKKHFATQIKVEQPLINVDAWMGKSAASHALKATELKGEYTQKHITYAVKQTYFGLQLATGKLSVIKKAREAAQSYLKMAEDNLEQGYLKEADVLSVKVRLLELEAMEKDAQNQIKSVSEMLNFLIGRDVYLPISISDSITKVAFTHSGSNSVSNRSDVLAMQHGMKAREQMKKSDLMKFVPRINGFGMYNMYDENFGGTEADSWMVGINLNWKLFNGGRNLGKAKKSKAQFHKSEIAYNEYLDKGNMELMQAHRQIMVSESNLMTYEMAAKQAKESLRIRTDRYDEGLERTSDLLTSEATYAESELKYLNAIYLYNLSVFKYELLSSESGL